VESRISYIEAAPGARLSAAIGYFKARRSLFIPLYLGFAFGTAGYAALLVREAVRVSAQHWDTLNFLHGPMEPNDRRTGVVLFGSGREVKLAHDLAGFGIAAVLITDRADAVEVENLVVIHVPALSPGLANAILEALPAQLLVAALMEAAGLPECNLRYRQSDTKLPQ